MKGTVCASLTQLSATRRAAAWASSLGLPTMKFSKVKRGSRGAPISAFSSPALSPVMGRPFFAAAASAAGAGGSAGAWAAAPTLTSTATIELFSPFQSARMRSA